MNDADTPTEQNQPCPLYAIVNQHGETEANWIELWARYAESPEFTKFIRNIAARLLRKYSIPQEWCRDIEQECMIYFASILQRKPDLGYDPRLGTFRGWLFVILNRCCLKAIRQFKDSLRQRSEYQMGHFDQPYSSDIDYGLDFAESIERLEEKLKTPLLQYIQGQSVKEISQSSGIGQRTIYRRVNLAITELRRILTCGSSSDS